MVVGTAGNQTEAFSLQAFGKSLGILDNVFCVLSEFRLQSFAKSNSLSSNNVHQRATLNAGENSLVDFLGIFLVIGQNQTAARTTQSFMGSSGYDISIRNRRRMQACCNQTGDVCHINQQQSAVSMRDISDAFEIDNARISAGTGNNQFRMMLFSQLVHSFIINQLGFRINSIMNNVEISTGNIYRGSMAQMTALGQVHTHNGIAGFQESKVHGQIGAGTAVSLYVSIFSME